MHTCETCKAALIEGIVHHKCHPKWLVWPEEEGPDSASTIFAFDDGYAAEEWAERDDNDSAENSIARGNKVRVFVQAASGETPPVLFEVSGEYQPTYRAELIDRPFSNEGDENA